MSLSQDLSLQWTAVGTPGLKYFVILTLKYLLVLSYFAGPWRSCQFTPSGTEWNAVTCKCLLWSPLSWQYQVFQRAAGPYIQCTWKVYKPQVLSFWQSQTGKCIFSSTVCGAYRTFYFILFSVLLQFCYSFELIMCDFNSILSVLWIKEKSKCVMGNSNWKCWNFEYWEIHYVGCLKRHKLESSSYVFLLFRSSYICVKSNVCMCVTIFVSLEPVSKW